MSRREQLFAFEARYPFLYAVEAGGVPIYTCHRDAVLACLQKRETAHTAVYTEKKGRVFPQRILDGAVKLLRFRKRESLIFTSAVYRRDNGRNLAAEYLTERYPNAAVFEWPHRVEAYDRAYFLDPNRGRYCPLDFYLVLYKLYRKLFQKKYRKLADRCRAELTKAFASAPAPGDEREQAAVDCLMERLPVSYAETVFSHDVFRLLFRRYRDVRHAVDFWGSARENIIPVLPGEPESVELQHGVITSHHPGYMYPAFVKGRSSRFFGRTMLVYGEKTRQQLVAGSIFSPEQVEVIGNPRIIRYKALYAPRDSERRLILFASQPYEQDGVAAGYYDAVITYLQKLRQILGSDPRWAGYELAVKLHPRENNGAAEVYHAALPGITVHGNAAQLYELLSESFLQVTVSSTSLYEAAEFDTPTVVLAFAGEDHGAIFGFEPWRAEKPDDLPAIMERLGDPEQRDGYIQFLKEKTKQYM